MRLAKLLIAGIFAVWLLLMGIGLAQQAQSPALDPPSADAQRHLLEAEQQVFDRDAEIVHLRTEIANCHATIDSLELGRQVSELVRRCETTFSVKCRWDDAQRRVVKDAPAVTPTVLPSTPDPPPVATSPADAQER